MVQDMEKTAHTPQPWHIVHEPTLSTYHIRVENIDAAPVASLFYSSGGSRPQLKRETVEANARLIAASPDLLAALEALVEGAEYAQRHISGGGFTSVDKAIDAARAAIAKTKTAEPII